MQEGQAATVAFVHGDSVQANYEFIAERERALFVAVQQAQMAVERMATPLQEEAQELIAYASGPNVAEDEVQIAQTRLYEIEAQLAQIQNESQTRLVQLENQLQAEVATRLSEEVAVFAEENGLEVVLNWGLSGEGCPVRFSRLRHHQCPAGLHERPVRTTDRRREFGGKRRMSTAAAKKNAHIVEYVLYVWQMEDLVRAAQFSETAIEGLFNGEGGADCDWLLKLNTQMQREKLEEKGHISDVLEVQTELALLHDLLTGPMEDEIYVSAFQTAEPILQELEQNKMGEGMRHPTETMLTALYGWLVLKMRKEDVTLETQSALQPIREMANALARGHVKIYQGK